MNSSIFPRGDKITNNGKGGDNRNRRRNRNRQDARNGQQQQNRSPDSGRRRDAQGQGQNRSQGQQNAQGRRNNRNQSNKGRNSLENAYKSENRVRAFYDRPKWQPPKQPAEPLPAPECPWCGRPITDIALAIADRKTGTPLHFECVIERLAEDEKCGPGETLSYIGAGRFGILSNAGGTITIKKILEWENKDARAPFREIVAGHYSLT